MWLAGPIVWKAEECWYVFHSYGHGKLRPDYLYRYRSSGNNKEDGVEVVYIGWWKFSCFYLLKRNLLAEFENCWWDPRVVSRSRLNAENDPKLIKFLLRFNSLTVRHPNVQSSEVFRTENTTYSIIYLIPVESWRVILILIIIFLHLVCLTEIIEKPRCVDYTRRR